jgi:hypothetical protein
MLIIFEIDLHGIVHKWWNNSKLAKENSRSIKNSCVAGSAL